MTIHFKAPLKDDLVLAFTIALVWQLIMTVIGCFFIPDTNSIALFHHTTLWDGGWYLNIIHEHYRFNPASPAFYPLFPMTISLVAAVTFHILSYPVIGLLVNTVALGFAIAGLLTVAKHFGITSRLRYLCVALLLISPAAFFFHQFYGEAIFAAIGFWAYAFSLRKKWLYVGILLAILTASRLPSLLFVGLCGLEYLHSYNWNIKKALNPNIIYFLLAPIGFIAYGLYLLGIRDDFFAMFSAYHATNDWVYQSFNPNFLYPILHSFYELLLALIGRLPFTSELLVNSAIPLFSLIILLGCSLYLAFNYRGKGVPLGIFGLVSIAFFTLNNNLVSVHRYILPCLCIYIALTLLYQRQHKWRPAIIILAFICLCIQALLIYWLYTTNKFVG